MRVLGVQYCFYGDPAYCFRPYLQVGFQGSNLTEYRIQFNSSVSNVRIAVEWNFRDIKMYFTHIYLPRKLKMGVTPASLWYVCFAIFWNFRICMYGIQTAEYFDYESMSIEEYLE